MMRRTPEASISRREKSRVARTLSARSKLEALAREGRDLDGATAMLVTLRYLMNGGDWFFGLHGGSIEPFFRKLYQDKGLCKWYVPVPHEQIAGHAAAGFAESTGKVGVAVVTSGPGVMNVATACYDAMMDSVPVVFIAGNVSQAVSGSRAFQEAPVRAVFKDISKKVFYVTGAEELPSTLFEAFRLAKSGRPGPVVVDLPKDVLIQKARFKLQPNDLDSRVENASPDYSPLAELAGRIASAKRPVLYVGGGIKSAEAWDELRQLVEKTGIPVVYTLKGKGALPDNNLRCIGPVGMHGSVAANYAVDAADLLIAVGARFDDRVTGNPSLFAPNAYIAHFDVDSKGIGPGGDRQRKPHLVVKGNCKTSLEALCSMVGAAPDLSGWYAQIEGWQQEFPFWYHQKGNAHKSDFAIKPQFVLDTLSNKLKEDAENVIYVTDVGQHQMWAMQWLGVSNPRGFLTSGGSGTMGYGLPAALAAKLANPDKKVVLISGDLSLRMTAQTLELYKSLGLDITVMVIDNYVEEIVPGGMVKQWLNMSIEKTTKLKGAAKPAIASIVQGYGIDSFEITEPNHVTSSVEQALARRGPQVLIYKVDPKEDVYPMIPPGKTAKDIIYKPLPHASHPAQQS